MGVASAAAKQVDRDSSNNPAREERLGGARADFVANLGKRRAELAASLDALRTDPSARRPRDELRRRVHALASASRLLRFESLGQALREVELALEAAAERGSLDDADFGRVHDLVGRMTSLAWGPSPAALAIRPVDALRPAARESEPVSVVSVCPTGVLVLGGPHLADALAMPVARGDEDGQAFEVERSDDVHLGIDLARAVAPDVVVIDGDLRGARELVERLVSDPLLETIPVIVCLKLQRAEDAAPFMALGVARTLAKPVSPGELRRAVVAAVGSYVRREVSREPLGELNLDQLGARLAEELRRGLCDVVDSKGRSHAVSLGEGTEVLAALWGAVARIRDVVTIRSQGEIRFAAGGPEGAVPLAPWIGPELTGGVQRQASPTARGVGEISLEGTRIVVADDDPAVCWFMAGVLKSAGARVYEARDGERALEIAKHCEPDLVVTDVLMPKLDGFALCRALKRDVVLRDVPVVLLSWKEDLLQRVRELGADADGYLRKEASAGVVVQRVRELLHRRARIAQRIAANGEIRGRLDGFTAHTLLRMACKHRPASTLSLRDATYLYEIEIRDGRPIRATRSNTSGVFERGPQVIAALLGVGDGRFVVAPPREDGEVGVVRSELDGALGEQLMPVIGAARAAQRLLSGANLLGVERITLDASALADYLVATPEPARGLMRRISAGEAPRALITRGDAAAWLVEDVLADAAAHGAVREVIDREGHDHMPDALDVELRLLRGERAVQPILSLPVLAEPTPMPAPLVEVSLPTPSSFLRAALAPSNREPEVFGLDEASSPAGADARALDEFEPEVDEISPPISSGARAILSESFTEPEAAPQAPEPTAPPKAQVVLELSPPAPAPKSRELTPTPSSLPPPPGTSSMLTLGSLHPPPVVPEAKKPAPKNTRKTPLPAAVEAKRSSDELTPLSSLARRLPLPSAYMPNAQPPKRDYRALYWVLFALVGVGFAAWARWSRERTVRSETEMMRDTQNLSAPASGQPEVQTSEGAGASAVNLEDGPSNDAKSEGAAAQDPGSSKPSSDVTAEDLPLRDGQKLKKGHGLLEVIAAKSDTIYLDGKPIGSGPILSTPLRARTEPYEVKVKTQGQERTRFVTIADGRLARVRANPPWQR
jgi:CheY-like chemotaxis protein/HPt (histidine-containing phosphotransfer) domain-containing protein